MNRLNSLQIAPWLAGLACGLGMLFVGGLGPGGRRSGLRGHGLFEFDRYTAFDATLAIAGVAWIGVALWRLVPMWRHVLRAGEPLSQRALCAAGTPRAIYELLLGVAAADGRIDGDERAVVARVLTEQAPQLVTAQDLKNWSATVEPPRDPLAVARGLAPTLPPLDRAAVFEWCRAVAMVADIDPAESDLLARLRLVLRPPDVTGRSRQ